jgi:ribosomal protein S27E
MVIVRVNKNESKLFKALTLGTGNLAAYNFYVDKEPIATLNAGQETQVIIQPGKHKVYFKLATWGGASSNKMMINFEPDQDLIIEAVNGTGGLVASYRTIQHGTVAESSNATVQSTTKTIKCPGCGVNSVVSSGQVAECEFCGTPLTFQ